MLETQTSTGKIESFTNEGDITHDHGKLIDAAIEHLTHWAVEEFGNDELVAARDDFFANFGKVFHDDRFFGSRMSYFTNYYVFERPVKLSDSKNSSPIRFYLDTNPERKSADEIAAVHNVSLCIHGVFQVVKVKKDDAVFENIISKERIPVKLPNSYRMFGLSKNQILQGFVFRTPDGYHPAAGIFSHAEGVEKVIKKAIKKHQKETEFDHLQFLGRLAATQLKSVRMKHVDPKAIYKTELA